MNRLLVYCSTVEVSSHSVRDVCNQAHFRNRWAAHWAHRMPRTPRIPETNMGARVLLDKQNDSVFACWMCATFRLQRRKKVFVLIMTVIF